MKKKRTKKILIWSGSILLALILLSGGVLCILLGKMIDREPVNLDRGMDLVSTFSAANKLNRARRKLTNTRPGDIAVLELEDGEFNAAIIPFFKIPVKSSPDAAADVKGFDVVLKDGIFTLRVVLKLKKNTWFGQYVNLFIQFRLAYANGKETVVFLTRKAGTLSLPEKQCREIYAKFRNRYFTGSQYEQALRNCVREIRTDDGISVMYLPYKVVDEVDRIFYEGTGEFRKMMDDDDD